ncbi:MAG: hypothetical protein GY772_25415, partial [bacterium]|nr:hypothetical protein [bacterium]
MRTLTLFLFLCTLLSATPAELETWRDWYVAQKQSATLPALATDRAATFPLWRGPLTLHADNSGGRFEQEITVLADTHAVLLPGKKQWPTAVTSNGRAIPVVSSADGRPACYLPKGTHRLRGSFRWEKRPVMLAVPDAATPLVLTVLGEAIAFPFLEGESVILGEVESEVTTQENRLDMKVYRLLADGVPQLLTTRLELTTAGTTRELPLGRVVPDGAALVSVESTIPALVDEAGLLRAQVKSGRAVITIVSRFVGDESRFVPTSSDHWPAQELWSIALKPEQRTLTVSGGAQVDPTQMQIPHQWRRYSSYLLEATDTLRFTETAHTEGASKPNELTLKKRIIFDTNGDGATVVDRISGTLYNDETFVMRAPYEIGTATMQENAQTYRMEIQGNPLLLVQTDSGIGAPLQRGTKTL